MRQNTNEKSGELVVISNRLEKKFNEIKKARSRDN